MEIGPLTVHTGIEVTGVDLRRSPDAGFNKLLARHCVVVFRDQRLSPPEFMLYRLMVKGLPLQIA